MLPKTLSTRKESHLLEVLLAGNQYRDPTPGHGRENETLKCLALNEISISHPPHQGPEFFAHDGRVGL